MSVFDNFFVGPVCGMVTLNSLATDSERTRVMEEIHILASQIYSFVAHVFNFWVYNACRHGMHYKPKSYAKCAHKTIGART